MKCQCYANRKSVTISNWHAFLPTCPIYHYICRYDLGITPSDAKNQSHRRQKNEGKARNAEKIQQSTFMWHHTDRQDKIRITCTVELISQQIDRPTERHQPFHHEISHPSHIAYSLIDIIKYTKQETRDMFVTYLRVEKAYIDTALPTTHSSVWKTIIHLH